jgi:acyl-CoA thioesterase-1
MSGRPFERLHRRLQEKADDVRVRPVIYVAFGDSVTQGCMEYGVVEHEQVFHQLLKRLIEEKYPRTVLSVINAGISGDTADQSRGRWQRDLFMYQPDLVTIGFGVNDAHAGPEGLAGYITALSELIAAVRTRTPTDILLLTPNMMIKRDNPMVHDMDRPAVAGFLKTAKAEYLPMYRKALLDLAQEVGVPCLDMYGWWLELERQGYDIHTRLANGINHPDRAYHRKMAKRLAEIIGV